MGEMSFASAATNPSGDRTAAPLSRISSTARHRFTFTLGRGGSGARLELETFSGDIKLRRPGEVDVEKVGAYLAEHGEAIAAVTAAMTHPIPASYATLAYHALHSFGFVAADGKVRYGRYHLLPVAGETALSEAEDALARARAEQERASIAAAVQAPLDHPRPWLE